MKNLSTSEFRGATVVGDVNGDGGDDIFFNFESFVFIASPGTDDPHWGRSYRPGGDLPAWRPFDGSQFRYRAVGDADGGIEDLVAFTRRGRVALVSVDRGSDELSVETVREGDVGGEVVPETVRTIGDRTGDGYEELLMPVSTDEGTALVVYAPGEGQVVGTFETAREWTVRGVDGTSPVTARPGPSPFAASQTSPSSPSSRGWRASSVTSSTRATASDGSASRT